MPPQTKNKILEAIKASGAVPEKKELDLGTPMEIYRLNLGYNQALQDVHSSIPKIIEVIVGEIEKIIPKLNNIPTSHRKTAHYVANTTKDQIINLLKE